MKTSMLEQYGGAPFVTRLVMRFYDRVLETQTLAGYFSGIDMRRLIERQAKFLSTLMGGPLSYSDEELERIHHHLAIAPADFDRTLALLEEALRESGMSRRDCEYVSGEFVKRRAFIIKSAD